MRRAPRLLRVFSVSILGGGVGRMGYFIGLTLLAWLVSADSFGRFSALYASVQAISGVIGSSASVASARVSAETADGGRPTKGELALPFGFGLFGGILGMLALPTGYFLLTGESVDWRIGALGFATALSVSCDGFLGTYAGKGLYATVAVSEASRGILAFSSVVATAFLGPQAAVMGILVSEGLVAGVLFLRASGGGFVAIRHSAGARTAVAIAGTGMIASALVQVAGWTLNYAISASYGIAQLGAYGVANRFATFALVLPSLLTRNMVGRLSASAVSRDYGAFIRDFWRYSWAALGLSLVAGLSALLISWWPMGALFSKYADARWFLLVIIAAAIPSALGSALGVILVSLDLKRAWLVSDVVLAVATVSSLFLILRLHTGVVPLLYALPIGQVAGTAVRVFTVLKWRNGVATNSEELRKDLSRRVVEPLGGGDVDREA